MIGAIIAGTHLLGVASAVDAVMSARTAQGSIAWAVSLVTFPYLAVPAYWVLGRSRFQGYVMRWREGMLRQDSIAAEALSVAKPFILGADEIPAAAHTAQRLARMPFSVGNAVTLLVDGEATFDDIIEGVTAAEEYVLVQFYTIRDDRIGRRLQGALAERARAGVRVHVLYDEVGSIKLPRAWCDELREAGAEVHPFGTTRGLTNRFQLNFRNHRKIVVVDGRTAWIGGHNVGDEYLGRNPKFGDWRDTHVRIEGPAALGAQLSFAEDWHWACDRTPLLNWAASPAADGASVPVLVIPTGPADEFETTALMFTHAINSARERLWVASPYFVPDQGVIAALQLAAMRGVDVRILIPDRPDHFSVYLSAFTFFEEATAAGVRFYRYTAGFLHEKVLLIDEAGVAVGTANFDNRSFRLNFEITALMADTELAGQVEEMFLRDFERSKEVADDEFSSRPFWFRLGARLARLTAPIQ